MPKDEYEGPNQDQMERPEDADTPVLSISPSDMQVDYEARFMKDAVQRAHDAELSALASLALIRSDKDLNGTMLLRMERDLALSPRMVDKHLRADEATPKPKNSK